VNKFSIDSNPLFREINSMIVTAIRGDFIDNPDFNADFFENDEYYLARLNQPMKCKLNAREIEYISISK